MPHRLFEALKAKDTAEFNRVLRQLKSSYKNELLWCLQATHQGETLFTCAVENNRIVELTELLKINAQYALADEIPLYDKPNANNLVPIIIAINKQNIDALRLLIQFGVRPNDVKINDQSLIQYAAKKAENPSALIFLISVGTKLAINVEETPLTIVSKYGYVSAQIYIEAGLHLQIACENIVRYQDIQVLQDFNDSHGKENSSSLTGRKDELVNIIESNLSNCLKSTPKLIADFLENLECNLVQYPIKELGKQLLYQWIMKLSVIPDMLRKFITVKQDATNLLPLIGEEIQFDPNAINQFGYTQLHIAIIRKSRDLLMQQIEKGADVNQRDNAGYTPVIMAALNNNQEAMIMLIAAGADITYQLNNGTSAITIAKQSKNTAMVKILDAAVLLARWFDELQRYELFVVPNVKASGTLITAEEKESRCLRIEGLFKQCAVTSAQLFSQFFYYLFTNGDSKPFQEKGMILICRCLIKLDKLPDFFSDVFLLAANYLYNLRSPIAWLILDKSMEFGISQSDKLMQQYFERINEYDAIEIKLYKFYLLEIVLKSDWYYCIDITKRINQILNAQRELNNATVNSKHYVLGKILFEFAISRTDNDIAEQDLDIAQKCFLKVGVYKKAPELIKKVNEEINSYKKKAQDNWKNISKNGPYNREDFEFLTILKQFVASRVVQDPITIQNNEDSSGVRQRPSS